jgi:hypothetical protein
VILGRACPNEIKDERKCACIEGWSLKHGFVRIYLILISANMPNYSVVTVPVQKYRRHTRNES